MPACLKNMRTNRIIGLALALLCCLALSAQDLKPAKDKATKKYGYQSKAKVWVIPPRFDGAKRFSNGAAEVELNGLRGLIDASGEWIVPAEYDDVGKIDKNGYCTLVRKVGGVKLYGIADRSGRIVIPVESRGVSVDRDGRFLYAKYDVDVPGFKPGQFWGVYDGNGREVFAPQFKYSPSFSGGVAVVTSGVNGLEGAIAADGTFRLPFKYLDISHYSGGYKALGTDFSVTLLSPDLYNAQTLPQIGAVIPYDPQDDIIRVAAWHSGPIGVRLHRNNLKAVVLSNGMTGPVAQCSDLPVDWGFGRFVRLEPCVVPAGTPDAMLFASENRYYTLKAFLYEPDGRLVRELCSRGWIEAFCADGVIYNAGGTERWMLLSDINAPARPAFALNLAGYQAVSHADVFSGLGIMVPDVTRLQNLYDFAQRCKAIYESENIGLNSYALRVPDLQAARAAQRASRSWIFNHRFHMGEVVNCSVRKRGDHLEVDLFDDLVCRFHDKIGDPNYSMTEGDELIYWGPNNARTVGLSLEAVPASRTKATQDDRHRTGYSYVLILSMYEEDGSFLRTLAEAPWVDYVEDGVLVFEPLGIALVTPFISRPWNRSLFYGSYGHAYGGFMSASPARREGAIYKFSGRKGNHVVRIRAAEPMPHTLSALEAAFTLGGARPAGPGPAKPGVTPAKPGGSRSGSSANPGTGGSGSRSGVK